MPVSRRRRPGVRSGGLLACAALSATVVGAPAPTLADHPDEDPVVELDTWAWCGVDPDAPNAAASVATMADIAGIDVTFGPCIQPEPGYTPAEPNIRYAPPDVYERLVDLNASVGIRTVVYDRRLWDPDPMVRDAAVAQWQPRLEHIVAWDLGDEFDPDGPEWPILIERWDRVRDGATAATGIEPFVNHLHWSLDDALRDLPGSEDRTSFTRYVGDKGDHIAREHDALVDELLCGVNAFRHFGLEPTAASIRTDMALLRNAGCDAYLVFGGYRVLGTDLFGEWSLTYADGSATPYASAVRDGATFVDTAGPAYRTVTASRLLDTRTDGGPVVPRSTTRVQVTGRAGVPADASAVVLAVTVTEPSTAGFVTVWPCDLRQPNAAVLTHPPARTVLNTVIVAPDPSGEVCLYSQSAGHLVVDVSGYQPAGSKIDTVVPARLLETRTGPGLGTVDGEFSGIGVVPGGTVTELTVAGRGAVPDDAAAVVVNLTVTEPPVAGFVTAFPCGRSIPGAAAIAYDAGATVSNAVAVGVGGGRLCLYNSSDTHLVVDVAAWIDADAPYSSLQPARLIDTRSGARPSAGSTTAVEVAGSGGVPTDAAVAVVNVTAVAPSSGGFVTAFACGAGIPLAATLTFDAGETRSALAVVSLGIGGRVCLYSSASADLVVDVTGYHGR